MPRTPSEALEIARGLAEAAERDGWPIVPRREASHVTDKVSQGYLPRYLQIAEQLGPSAAVCEVGVLGGASLELWQRLFPHGLVAGVDCDTDAVWPPGTIEVQSAQDDRMLPVRLLAHAPDGFDLIVDDASHDGVLTRRTWELLWPLVRPGGFYVIEDWFVGLGGPWLRYGDSMLRTAESFLPLLDQRGQVRSVTYEYGLIIMEHS